MQDCAPQEQIAPHAARLPGQAPGASTPVRKSSTFNALTAFWLLLSLVYLTWLIIFWPGVLGEDSAAILMEVDKPELFRSGKSVFWYYFVRGTYGVTHRVELPILILMLLCAFFFARMLAWLWERGSKRTSIFLLLYICMTPHMVYFTGTLYPDAIFAVASTALLFELWLVCTQRRLTRLSFWVLALAMPFAIFTRANGILFLVPSVLAILFVRGKSRYVLAALIAFWCALSAIGSQFHRSTAQSATHSLVLFETVKLMQPRAMNDFWKQMPGMNDPWVLQEPKLSARTLEILEGYRPKELFLAYSDPAYWDMLVFHPSGPQLLGLTEEQNQELTREFFRYNLWHNLPDVIGSRVNVLLTAALAQGGFPALDYAPYVLNRIKAKSKLRRFGLVQAESALRDVHKHSYQFRWLLWTPWLGLSLLLLVLWHGMKSKNGPILLVSVFAALQFAAIAAFASAGEYRYLLPFFTLPLALIPMLRATKPATTS